MRTAPTPARREVLAALLVSVLVAAITNQVYSSPFALVLLRCVYLGLALLFAFTLAGYSRQRLMARATAQVLAVVLVTPFAAYLAYLTMVGGHASVLRHAPKLMNGYGITVVTTMLAGVITALAALHFERKERARAAAVQADLDRSAIERELLDARLRLLQAQIEPHFLFNTLANIQALVEAGSPNAAPVLRHLIAYLRAAMPRLHDHDATLGNELNLVRAYLELMHLRMPDRLQFLLDTPPALSALRFPAMALLTLVENAVRHGIDPSEEGGRIEVGASVEAGSGAVTLWVVDTGVGLSEKAQAGTGLANVRARLQAYYGAGARLDLLEQAPHGVRAEIMFDPGSKA
ncbi:MAG: histidine kinase [Pseudomonadota bacterium]